MFSSASSQGRLTIDAVQTIVGNSMLPGQQLTVQLLQTQTNYLGYYYSELSDGYSKIKCELRQRIKLLIEQEQIKQFSVISIGKDDIEVSCEDERVQVVVKNCIIVNAQVSKMIGQPMPSNLYKANNYQNPNGDNEIDTTPKHYTIREIVNNTRLRNAHLKAKVIKLPDNIGKNILCFLLQDDQERQIQCVCYDKVAEELFLQLKLGSQYLFTGFVLQKNKKNNDDELRFRKESKVLLFRDGKVVNNNMGNNNTNNNYSKPNPTFQQPVKQQIKQQSNQIENNNNQPSTQNPNIANKRQLITHLSTPQSQQNTLFTVQGKVSFLIQKPKYRKINILDNHDDIIDLMLWQQVKQPIYKQKCYQFTLMKIKYTPQVKQGNYKYVQLHSTKKTKIIEINAQQLQDSKRSLSNANSNSNNNNYKPKYPQQQQRQRQQIYDKNQHKQTTKRLPDHIILNKLSDLLEIRQNGQQAKEKLASPYPYVECTLKFRTQGFIYSKSEDEILNYFSFYCGSCNKSTTTILSENNVVSCNKCKRDDVMVKWSLRVKALDFNFELPCSLQSQTTQRLLNMKAFDGYVLYQRQFTKFQTLLHKVNYERRVCKFQIREKQGSQYYNVLQVYAKETKSQVYNAMARLKQRIKQCQVKSTQQQIKNQLIQE